VIFSRKPVFLPISAAITAQKTNAAKPQKALDIIFTHYVQGEKYMSKRVMTVDDSATVRQVLQMTLEGAGYEVLQAVDGVDALRKLSSESVDMLVTDLNMPNMDGIALIKEVRQDPGNRFMPIVMLTTESQPEKKEEGKQAGASGWIVKPFKPEQLLAVVRMVCPT
jgi:two-component system chemotaxis response regulator CheY